VSFAQADQNTWAAGLIKMGRQKLMLPLFSSFGFLLLLTIFFC